MLRFSTLLAFVLELVASVTTVATTDAGCVAPQQLQAKLRIRPDSSAYVEIGTWFGDRTRFRCAADAYRSALKLDPNSARVSYLLGLSLYSVGDMEGAVKALRQSIQIDPFFL